MGELDAKRRARLPNSAFAHIDAKGRRRLPINDAAHVRNALARFNQGLQVRVRIGLHSGEPHLTETGYVGLAVHTAARVCSAGHGGQIVLSGAARAAAGSLAEGMSLLSQGSHQLHGLPDPEELFQVIAADLLTDFPPLRTLMLVQA